MDDGRAHICSAAVDCPARDAMAFLQAPENLASWAAGMGEARVHADGLIEGAFPDTKRPIWVRIDADSDRFTICFHVGSDRDSLVPRNRVRAVSGDILDGDSQACVVSLVAWCQETMDDARWDGLKSSHGREILTVKRLIEAGGWARATSSR